MGVLTLVKNLFFARSRLSRIIRRALVLGLRLHFGFRNYNDWIQFGNYGKIAQPAYFNSSYDYSLIRLVRQNLWSSDLNALFKTSEAEKKLFQEFNYDLMIKRYFPTKNTTFENINLNIAWANSYWNPDNTKLADSEKFRKYRRSDVLFGDYIVNTQGIYQAKRVLRKNEDGSENNEYVKVKSLFQKHLNENRSQILPDCGSNDVLETLIDEQNLYLVQFPELLELQKSRPEQQRYKNILKTDSGKEYEGYIEIPYAIFANVKNHPKLQAYPPEQRDFICLGTVFNQRNQIYHPFDKGDIKIRDAWEIAKYHFGSTFNNDFIIRVHLGYMHYGSAIYTTAFSNLAKSDKKFSWLHSGFLDLFSEGLLQVNFLANLTLVDPMDPLVEKGMYLRGAQSIKLISEHNPKLNMMQFCPEGLGKNSYQSDCVTISGHYYNRLENYVDSLFRENENSWKGQTEKMGKFIYDQLVKDGKKMDALPESICKDSSPNSLKKLMTNLIFLWVVHHGQTFSMVSMNNIFYMVPTFAARPLSALPNSPLSDAEKQKFYAPTEVFDVAMAVTKNVTYRNDKYSLISSWSTIGIEKYSKIKHFLLHNPLHKQKNFNERGYKFYGEINAGHSVYSDYWNDMTIEVNALQQRRLNEGLFYTHWMMPNELQNSLNI